MNVYVRELTRFLGRVGVHVDVFTRSQDEHIPQVSHDLGYFNRVVHVPAGPETDLNKKHLAQYTDEFAQRIIKFAEKKHMHSLLVIRFGREGSQRRLERADAADVPHFGINETKGGADGRGAGRRISN